MAVQTFPPRVGFVKQAQDGSYILTPEAYRFLRDAVPVLGSIKSVADIETLAQFGDVAAINNVGNEDVRSVMQESQYARISELSKRLDGIEIAMAQYADPTALLAETVKWGTYTPTLTNVTNVTASTAFACQYVRLGRMVCVSGRLSINPTVAATLTEVGLSLPIASDFVGGECSGSAGCSSSDSVAISEDVANNRAKLQLTPTDSADQTYRFVFMYKKV